MLTCTTRGTNLVKYGTTCGTTLTQKIIRAFRRIIRCIYNTRIFTYKKGNIGVLGNPIKTVEHVNEICDSLFYLK